MTENLAYPIARGLPSGLLGGLLGAIVMGAIAYMMPIPNTGGAPFFVAAAMLMGMGAGAIVAGWMLHLITGFVIGGIFGAITSKVSKLYVSNIRGGLGLGAIAGAIVWVVFFMPMMALLMPTLMSMGMMVAGSFVAHVIYGLILGAVVSALSSKVALYRCEACGASFGTHEELTRHGEEHMKIEQYV